VNPFKEQLLTITMSESFFDEYEHFNYDQDKYIYSGHSGKQRTKKEASVNTNRPDPAGHNRKLVTKMQNTEENKRSAARSRNT
jgi:nuclear protein 1